MSWSYHGFHSPWNSLIIVFKKKSGKWAIIQDLREVNETTQQMGALSPGVSSPTVITKDTNKIILDLKDCFYIIPLVSQDCHRVILNVPSVYFKEPMGRYHGRSCLRACQIVLH